MQISGRHFAESGFFANALTPVIDIGAEPVQPTHYTHYPPLPDFVNGLQQRLFGSLDISTYRILPDALSLISVVLFYRWVRSIWGALTANVAVVLLVSNLLWLQYADTIYHLPLCWCFGFLALERTAALVARPSYGTAACVASATFLCAMSSYDFLFFVPIVTCVTVRLLGLWPWSKAGRPAALAVACGAASALVVKLALVTWAIGLRGAYSDFMFQLEERATSHHSVQYASGLAPIVFGRMTRFFSPLLFFVAAMELIVLGRYLGKRTSASLATPLWLLAAAAPFLIVFSQLTAEQYHPMLQLLPFYAVAVASAVGALWKRARTWSRALAASTLLFAIAWQSLQFATFEKRFLARADSARVCEYLTANDRRNIVLTNAPLDAPIRAYFDRDALVVGGADDIVAHFVNELLDTQGDEPLHFIEFKDFEKIAFDKALYGLFAGERQWDWVANPGAHRAEWEPLLRERSANIVSAISRVGVAVVDTPTLRLWSLTRKTMLAHRAQALPTPTHHIDFGDRGSDEYKIAGIRFSERSDKQDGFAWTLRRQHTHYHFTMHGMLLVEDPIPINDARIVFRGVARSSRIVMALYASTPNQRVNVMLNGHMLGTWDVETSWATYAVAATASEFESTDVQELELEMSTANAANLGVAIRTLDIESR